MRVTHGPVHGNVAAPGRALNPNALPRLCFPGSAGEGDEVGVVRGAAGPSLCRRTRPVEPTLWRISPAGRYRSGPAKLDTRGLQSALQRSDKEGEGAHFLSRPRGDSVPE